MFACNCSECSASPTPYYYKTTLINKAIKKGKTSLECQNSFEDVDIDKLLGTYFSEKQLHEHRKKLTASILSNRKNDKIQQLNIASQLLKEYEEDLLLESDARKKMKYRIEIEALKQEIVKLENYFEKD